jgi:ADP-ribose pyrophosphatase
VLALDDAGCVLLVRQWRTPAGRALLEVPAGTLDRHDGALEDPDLAARRELEEETGFRAASWRRLVSFWTAPGFASELMHLYLATGLTAVDGATRRGPDEDEHVELRRVTLEEAEALVASGDIADAKTLLALAWLERLRATGGLPAGANTVVGPTAAADADPGAVETEVSFTPLEMALANAAWFRTQRSSLVVGGFLAVSAVIGAVVLGDLLLALPSALLSIAFLTGLFAVPFVWWQMRRKAPFLRMTMRFDRRGIETDGPLGHGLMPWSSFARIRASGSLLFLHSEGGMAVVGKTDGLSPEELDRVGRLALEHGLLLDGSRVTPPSAGRRPGA